MRIPTTFFAAAVALFIAAPAEASIDACGGIHVEADAGCALSIGDACIARCEPVNLRAACFADCRGSCDAPPEASCTQGCQSACETDCALEPVECRGRCETDCGVACTDRCEGDVGCLSTCEATCVGECAASCQDLLDGASCALRCEASCDGSCAAQARFDCQDTCQTGCASTAQTECEEACRSADGALFCDGQYVMHDGDLDACIDAIEARLAIVVDESARPDECVGDDCPKPTVAAEPGCTVGRRGPPSPEVPWLLSAIAVVLWRRRR